MSRKDKFNYIEAFTKQTTYAEEIALNLESGIKAGELGTVRLMKALHTVENDADMVDHLIHEHLGEDFVVPMERDSMSDLSHALEDVCDAVEDIAIHAYMYCVTELPEGGLEMIDLLSSACTSLRKAVAGLDNLGKNRMEIKANLAQALAFESQCDVLYVESSHKLYADRLEDGNACENLRISHAMLSVIEAAMDSVENAAERVETIVTENA